MQIFSHQSQACYYANTYIYIFRVTESKNKDFSVGDYVVSSVGWVDRAIGTAENSRKLPDVIPADKHSLGLGVLGMPG